MPIRRCNTTLPGRVGSSRAREPQKALTECKKAKVTYVFAEGLREAISNVKRDEYRRALDEAHDPTILEVIQHKIRTDSQLTQDNRVQLLGDKERAAALSR